MAAEAEGIVTSRMTANDTVTSATSVFDRYSWVGLLAVHGPTALQVSHTAACSASLIARNFVWEAELRTNYVFRPSVCVFLPVYNSGKSKSIESSVETDLRSFDLRSRS